MRSFPCSWYWQWLNFFLIIFFVYSLPFRPFFVHIWFDFRWQCCASRMVHVPLSTQWIHSEYHSKKAKMKKRAFYIYLTTHFHFSKLYRKMRLSIFLYVWQFQNRVGCYIAEGERRIPFSTLHRLMIACKWKCSR